MAGVAADIPAALSAHASIRAVRLIGSRAEGRAHELSDWDFVVETTGFEAVARDLPSLVEPFEPLAQQWDRYSPHPCYMLMLRGPVKVDLLFLEESQEQAGPWVPSAETLDAIDLHFWDWILWLEQKRRHRLDDVLVPGLERMHELMLARLGVPHAPASVGEAVASYLAARDELERRFRVRVSRELEREVRPAIAGA